MSFVVEHCLHSLLSVILPATLILAQCYLVCRQELLHIEDFLPEHATSQWKRCMLTPEAKAKAWCFVVCVDHMPHAVALPVC